MNNSMIASKCADQGDCDGGGGDLARDWFDWTPYIILAAVVFGTVCATLIRRQIVQKRKKRMRAMQSAEGGHRHLEATSTTTAAATSPDDDTLSTASSHTGSTWHSSSSTLSSTFCESEPVPGFLSEGVLSEKAPSTAAAAAAQPSSSSSITFDFGERPWRNEL